METAPDPLPATEPEQDGTQHDAPAAEPTPPHAASRGATEHWQSPPPIVIRHGAVVMRGGVPHRICNIPSIGSFLFPVEE
ncbi:MAG TPA: hypothetical protein VLE99_05535 [Candidatus Saccharimonadales bacterium]|nr:hypothetical protein [Candidatus Saccharimonadales bacterium]